MRPITITGLLALTLLATGCAGGENKIPPPPGFGKKPSAPAAERPRPAEWSEVVAAQNPTEYDARQLALGVARKRVESYLMERYPSLREVPPVDYLLSKEVLSVTGHKDDIKSPRLGTLHEVQVTARLTESKVEEILRWDRAERVEERQLLWGKLLAALIALLSVTAGYARLEEVTRGYYSGLLRIFYVACVGLVAAGLWLVI